MTVDEVRKFIEEVVEILKVDEGVSYLDFRIAYSFKRNDSITESALYTIEAAEPLVQPEESK